MNKLKDTGERLMPGILNKTAIEHLHRYALSSELVRGKKVLDIASGEGYGSNLLAGFADQVTGVDISNETILHAQTTYIKENLRFKQGSVLDIPFEKESFDIVFSFETLEHVLDQRKMISELKRVLKPDGILIISTPEKLVYSDQANYSNPYHEKELYEEEFINLINLEFEFHQLFYQKYLKGSLILSSQGREDTFKNYSGNFNRLDLEGSLDQEYMIAICNNKELTVRISDSFFTNGEMDKVLIEEMVNQRVKEMVPYLELKIKSGFRYKLVDFLFKPWDLIKGFIK